MKSSGVATPAKRASRGLAAAVMISAISPVIARQSAPAPAPPVVLQVTSAADDGPGTLRWAIAASNATRGRKTIELALDESNARIITLKSPLPPVKGPVQIVGSTWSQTGEYTVIDGSGYVPPGPEGCPGGTAGQYGANVRTMSYPGLQLIDTDDVEIVGVELRRFCIGVLINRATGVVIRDSRVVENHGGAGVMLTGDDGQGNPTSTTTIHNKVLRNEFVDNGDGLELTRGAAFNLIADNVFRSTAANPEPAQGIEILRGNDNTVSGNRFEGYSDGLQINWGDRNYIVANTFTNNTFGLNLTGVGNIVDRNIISGNRVGIAVRPAEPSPIVRLTRNRISTNGADIRRCEAGGSCDPMAPKGPMAFGVPGLEHARFVGSRGKGVNSDSATLLHICPDNAPRCQPSPNGGLRSPTLAAAREKGDVISVSGTIAAAPTSRYVVELFGNADPSRGEAEVFLSDIAVRTDSRGNAAFTIDLEYRRAGEGIGSLTATVTSNEGATSPLSAARIVESSSRAGRLPSR
jgi:3-dehydroshikimate dehydratase